MQYNKNFGKIEGENIIKFAPDDLTEQELLSDGWLPILPTDLEHQNNDEYVYIATGWEESEGHIQKKYIKRKKLEYMRKYSKDGIISAMGDRYQSFIQNLSSNYPELLSAFDQSTVYFESCNQLHECIRIYGEMNGFTEEYINKLLIPSIIPV